MSFMFLVCYAGFSAMLMRARPPGFTRGRLAVQRLLFEPAAGPSRDDAPEISPLVVLAHANGFCKEVWDPVLSELKDLLDLHSSLECLAFDFSGHGDSRPLKNRPCSWQQCLVEDVVECLEDSGGKVEGRKVYGIGHSMGASALVLTQLKRPRTFDGLLLIEPILFPMDRPSEGPHALADRTVRRKASWLSMEEATTYFQSRPLFQAWDPRALQAYMHGGLGLTAASEEGSGTVKLKCEPLTEAAYYRGSGQTVWPRLGAIGADEPVEVVAGQESEHMAVPGVGDTVTVFQQMVKRMGPQARLNVVPGASHFVVMEKPRLIAERIAALLASDWVQARL